MLNNTSRVISSHPGTNDSGIPRHQMGGYVPIASVRKENPSIMPIYPNSGKIHMIATGTSIYEKLSASWGESWGQMKRGLAMTGTKVVGGYVSPPWGRKSWRELNLQKS